MMTAILFGYNRKPRPPGRIIALAALMYAPGAILLDFVRATDVTRPDKRFLALTPAQWACLATARLGVYLWRRRPPAAPPRPRRPRRPTRKPRPTSPHRRRPRASTKQDSSSALARREDGSGHLVFRARDQVLVAAALGHQVALAKERRVAHERGQVRQIARPVGR